MVLRSFLKYIVAAMTVDAIVVFVIPAVAMPMSVPVMCE